ncbi:hypothetical protein RHSIM_Rhsim07G0034900 [Rhododendron simsii]|uniref:F-box domain-containing protein n=1 Tax=Rhododendron simsii TaxID=118357 RepID=A0A834LJM8_RHOSS|nr:hypothetical protein RHSIM_Rhsim07G0034900 [Rhododendron simsii]
MGNDKGVLPSYPETEEGLSLDHQGLADWTRLPNDTVIHLFSTLNYRDRANLASTCRIWRNLGMSPCLWQSLDLRAHKCEASTTSSLASRCENLKKLRFCADESAAAIINLKARGLCEISGDHSGDISDTTLTVIAARHEALEIVQPGPFYNWISRNAIKAIAICCPNLRKLRRSGIRDVDGDAINALAKHCMNLIEIGFVDCRNVDEVALGNVVTLRFLSVAGTRRMNWASLKVLCALHCPALEEGDRGTTNYYPRGKLVIALFTDIFKELASLLGDVTKKESNVFSDWRNMKNKDKNLEEIMTWVEWILSYSLLWIADVSIEDLDDFWLRQGVALALSLMQSSQEDVQERATMAITNLSVNVDAAKAVVEEGGIKILSNLARSMSRSVAEEAAGELWNLSVTEEHKEVIAKAGRAKALVDLILRWCTSGDRVLEHAAGALANIAADDKLSMVVAEVGGLRALVMLAQNCKLVGVQEQVAHALANLVACVDGNSVKVGQEAGSLEALVELTYSHHESVR